MASLDKPGRETARAFFLEGWNGDSPFDYDTIGRGYRRFRRPDPRTAPSKSKALAERLLEELAAVELGDAFEEGRGRRFGAGGVHLLRYLSSDD